VPKRSGGENEKKLEWRCRVMWRAAAPLVEEQVREKRAGGNAGTNRRRGGLFMLHDKLKRGEMLLAARRRQKESPGAKRIGPQIPG